MTIKSPQTLVADALNDVKTITPEQAMKLVNENKCNLIDIRDIAELENLGRVEKSCHIPRSMLEFWIDPNSQYFASGQLDKNKEMVLFCAGGIRSALAAKTLKDMGYKNVSHINGGFSLMKQEGFKIIK